MWIAEACSKVLAIGRGRGARRAAAAFTLLIAVAAVLYQFHPVLFYRPLLLLGRSVAGLEERTTEVDGHTVHYLDGVEGEETIIFLHGIFAEKDHWIELARRLPPGYRVIALDLPGFGESSRLEGASYGYPAQAERLHRFVEALGLGSFHLAGNSMGGAVAVQYAVEHPERVRSLALIGGPHGLRPLRPTEFERRVDRGEAPLLAHSRAEFQQVLALTFAGPPRVPRVVVEHAAAVALRNADSNVRIWKEHVRHRHALDPLLPGVRTRTFFAWGEQDRLFDPAGAAALQRGIRNVSGVILPGCGHLPMMECPEETIRHYLDFLSSGDGSPPVPFTSPD